MNFKSIFCLSLSVALCACNSHNTTLPLVQMCEVECMGAAGDVVYPGRSASDKTSNLAFKVSGSISDICVEPGQNVKAGTVVAVLDSRDYATQYSATKAEYSQVKAEVERVIAMYNDGAVTANDYDKARYGLTQMEQKLRHHSSQLADCSLRAPFSGCVGEVLFHKGETVMAGIPVLSLFGEGSTDVVINLSASDFIRKDYIESAVATFTVLPGKEFPLHVSSISRMANANQLYEMHLALDEESEEITPGMTAMVTIRYGSMGEDSAQGAVIPSNAMFRKNNESFVYTYDDSTSCINAKAIKITSIRADGKAVVSGLENGDVIVSAGVSKLVDGQEVRRVEPVSEFNPGGLL